MIDLKTKEWINDPDMRKYLRLSTLFNAEKFEGYLQEAKRVPIKKIPKEWKGLHEYMDESQEKREEIKENGG